MAAVILFDIDGTLVTTAGGARQALLDAVTAQLGDPSGFDFSFGGMTDRGIMRRGLRHRGLAGDDPGVDHAAVEARIDALIADYLPRLERLLATTPVHRLLPGAGELARAAATWSGVAAGLGTGNVRHGATLKLRPFGLHEVLPFGGFGCDAELRADLIAAGHRRGAARLGVPLEQARLVIVGDTPLDVQAARANGGVTLAVATGSSSRAELQASGAEVVVDRLDEPHVRAALAELAGVRAAISS